MTCTWANNEMRIRQFVSQLLGDRQGSSRVVVAPHELDGTLQCSERRSVILGEGTHEDVTHDTRCRTVVIGPVAPP